MSELNESSKRMLEEMAKDQGYILSSKLALDTWSNSPNFILSPVKQYLDDVVDNEELPIENEALLLFFLNRGDEAFDKTVSLAEKGDVNTALEYYKSLPSDMTRLSPFDEQESCAREIFEKNSKQIFKMYKLLKAKLDESGDVFRFKEYLPEPFFLKEIKNDFENANFRRAREYLSHGRMKVPKIKLDRPGKALDKYLESDDFGYYIAKFYLEYMDYKVTKEQALKLLEKDLSKNDYYGHIEQVSNLEETLNHLELSADDVLPSIKNNIKLFYKKGLDYTAFIDNALYIANLNTGEEEKTDPLLTKKEVKEGLNKAMEEKHIPLLKGYLNQYHKFFGLKQVKNYLKEKGFSYDHLVDGVLNIKKLDEDYANKIFSDTIKKTYTSQKGYHRSELIFNWLEDGQVELKPDKDVIEETAQILVDMISKLKENDEEIYEGLYDKRLEVLAIGAKSKTAADYVLQNMSGRHISYKDEKKLYEVSGDVNIALQNLLKDR